jgi:hypothetical protein
VLEGSRRGRDRRRGAANAAGRADMSRLLAMFACFMLALECIQPTPKLVEWFGSDWEFALSIVAALAYLWAGFQVARRRA